MVFIPIVWKNKYEGYELNLKNKYFDLLYNEGSKVFYFKKTVKLYYLIPVTFKEGIFIVDEDSDEHYAEEEFGSTISNEIKKMTEGNSTEKKVNSMLNVLFEKRYKK